MNNNKGSAVIEACITIPLFLLFLLFIIYLYRMIYADAHIHQCLAEASIYYAQRCYLEEKLVLAKVDDSKDYGVMDIAGIAVINGQFRKYMGDDACTDQVVAGGKNGIVISVMPDEKNKKVFVARAGYMNKIDIPLLCKLTIPRVVCVKQKAFLGYDPSDKESDNDTYVYVTPNESVYHVSRNCSHLSRNIHEKTVQAGDIPCGFCGKDGNNGKVYVTDSGGVYHNDRGCIGLKRTVMRVRKNSVINLEPCTRCGR